MTCRGAKIAATLLLLATVGLDLLGCGTAENLDDPLLSDTTLTAQAEEVVDLFPVACRSERGYVQWGFIDKSGRLVIELQYAGAGEFAEGLAPVCVGVGEPLRYSDGWPEYRDHVYGYVDRTGRMAIAPSFETAEPFSEGLALVRQGDKSGYIDTNGVFVLPPQFEDAGNFSEGLAPVKVSKRWGFIDKTGEFVVEPQYRGAQSFSEGPAPIETSEGYGFIDKTGEFVIDPEFEYTSGFEDGLASVRRHVDDDLGDEEGFIDKTGQLVIPYQYQQALHFSAGMAPVLTGLDRSSGTGGKWNFIDKTGAIVLGPFAGANPFYGGLALVWLSEDERAYIDTAGAVVWTEP